ncbi:MAG: CcdB family protein [Notoacmeibacter sp.]|nr:CcdB family protein [Notoacmeibacter sp.]
MAQFDVYAPANGTALVVDIQSDVLDGLATRAVIPLVPLQAAPKPIIRLNPMMDVNGIAHSLMTDWMSAVPKSVLGQPVTNLAAHRDSIVSAVDMLVTGI